MRRALAAVLTLVAVSALAVATTASARSSDTKLSLVAYSTPREALGKLITSFQKTGAGNGVSFTQSYGASGDQARAVSAGLKADIVYLSLAPDVDTLVRTGLVDAKWNRQSYKGIVTNSVVVFAVRDGNPKKLRTWDDLTKPGVPKATILIENPIAVLEDSADKDAANGFLRYLKTPGAQQIFADYGYRPVVKSVLEANRKKFPKRPDLFTINNLGLGGWDKVQKVFFDPNTGVMAGIERQVGGVTG